MLKSSVMTSTGFAIPFVKASACGNDFLIVDGEYASENHAELTRILCDRNRGIGADGVEWLFPDAIADIYARLFNADGSEAEISGNGTRCVAAYLLSDTKNFEDARQEVSIRTGAGIRTCKLTASSGTRYEFETDMGVPEISGEVLLDAPSGQVRAISISMGNPHLSVFVEEFGPNWPSEAAEIARCSGFPDGVNVEFVKIRDVNYIEARFFERGAGETQSSGTGSCAAAVAAIWSNRAKSPIRVYASGGAQTIRWDEKVFLRGPAQILARGEFFPPESS